MDCSPQGSSAYGIFQGRNWNGLPFPSPEGLPTPELNLHLLNWRGDFLPLSHVGSNFCCCSFIGESTFLNSSFNKNEVGILGNIFLLSLWATCLWEACMLLCYSVTRPGLGSTYMMHSKDSLLTLVCGERKYNVYHRVLSSHMLLYYNIIMLKRPELPNEFQEIVLKAMWGRGLQDDDQLVLNSQGDWHQGEISSIINIQVSIPLVAMCLKSVFIWRGSASYKNNLGMWVRPLSVSLTKLRVWRLWFVADL